MTALNLLSTILLLILLSPLSLAQDRDLSSYEKMEYVVDGAKENSAPYQTKEREFLWSCWLQKRRCYAYLKIELKDTQPTIFHFYIEPNEKGIWNAVYQLDAQMLSKDGNPKGKPIHWEYRSQEVTRVEPVRPGGSRIKEIPADEARTADRYMLYLKLNRNAIRQGFELLFKNGTTNGLIF